MYNLVMKNKNKHSRIYLDIVIVMAVTVIFAVFFTWMYQKSSQEKVLNTLSELSDQGVNVVQEEVEKNKILLINLAIYISEDETKDVDKLVEKLEDVDDNNGFKRMGIIGADGYSKGTDGTSFVVDYSDEFSRFRPAREGQTSVSDRIKDLADGEDVTVYATPINWPDGTRYVLFGTYEIEDYRKILSVSTFGGEGYSYIIKRDGDCVINSENHNGSIFDNYYEFVLKQSSENTDEIEKMQKEVENGKSGFVSFDTKAGNRYVYYQPLNTNDWYLLSVIPQKVVEKHINGPMLLAYATLFVFILGIMYLSIRVYGIQIKNKKMLEHIAFVDEITGGASYTRFRMDVQELLAKQKEKQYAVIAFNIQRFQYINDLYGYEEGDKILRKVMEILKMQLKEHECSTRIQADHFAALLVYNELEELENRVEEIVLTIQEEAENRIGETPYLLKIHAGAYLAEHREELPETMIDRAFEALRQEYNTKNKLCSFYDNTIRSQILRNKGIEDRFSEALKNHEFFLCYQPKFCVAENRFGGSEALVRWNDPYKGLVSPGEFIPILERNGGIVELDEYVLEMVCRQIRQWITEGIHVLPVSVNVSQLHLYRIDFVEQYLKIIDTYQIPHELIQLEMTETALFGNEDILSESLETLRNAGIKILMDDFGSGYSSVVMLKSMPIDILKIDKSMIDSVEDNEKVKKILEGIVALAQSLNMKVTGEGVENKAQYDILKRMGIDDIQGFYCARPMPVEDYVKILKEVKKEYEY